MYVCSCDEKAQTWHEYHSRLKTPDCRVVHSMTKTMNDTFNREGVKSEALFRVGPLSWEGSSVTPRSALQRPFFSSLKTRAPPPVLGLTSVLALFGRWIGEPVWALKRYLSSYLNAERCQSQFLARYCRYYLSADFVGSWISPRGLNPEIFLGLEIKPRNISGFSNRLIWRP